MSSNYLIIIPEITKGMKSIGSKSLLKINSQLTILDYQIKSIKKINRRNKIFLSTGFQHNKINKTIERYRNVTTIYEKNFSAYNETKHIINYIKHVNRFDDLFIVNSGIIFRNDCFKNIKKNESKIFFLDKTKDNFNIGCGDKDTDYLFYDFPILWSECIFLKDNDLEKIFQLNQKNNLDHYFLFETINKIYSHINIQKITIPSKDIMKINGISDIPKARRFI